MFMMFVQAGLDRHVGEVISEYINEREELILYMLSPSGMDYKIANSVYVQTASFVYLSQTCSTSFFCLYQRHIVTPSCL